MEDEIIKGKPIKWIVKDVVARDDYSLLLTFITGEIKVFDARVLLDNPIYEKLNDISFFLSARCDGSSVVWGEDIDIAPEYLYENSRIIST